MTDVLQPNRRLQGSYPRSTLRGPYPSPFVGDVTLRIIAWFLAVRHQISVRSMPGTAGQALSSRLYASFVRSYSLVASSPPRGRYARRLAAGPRQSVVRSLEPEAPYGLRVLYCTEVLQVSSDPSSPKGVTASRQWQSCPLSTPFDHTAPPGNRPGGQCPGGVASTSSRCSRRGVKRRSRSRLRKTSSVGAEEFI
jgi:hypothetical protein